MNAQEQTPEVVAEPPLNDFVPQKREPPRTYYSASSNAFYNSDVHEDIPPDAVEVSQEEHEAVIRGQAAGKLLVPGRDGKPSLKDHPPQQLDLRWTALRRRRNVLLAASDWTQLPDSGLGKETKAAWAAYRKALRDLPATVNDPAKAQWPEEPAR